MNAVLVSDGWIKHLSELKVEECTKPLREDGSVLIDIVSAGVNFFDLLMVTGKYQLKPGFPFIPGAEFAGVVTDNGGVSRFSVGDRVFGGNMIGAFAERISAPESNIQRLPDSLTFDQGAAMYITYPTAYSGLVRRAKLQAEETLLVLGGAGGVGLAAVKVAKALGATVIATASTSEKVKVLQDAGADHVILSTDEDWPRQVTVAAEKGHVDVVFDPVGLAVESSKCLGWHGRYIVVGFAGGAIPSLPMNRVLLKELEVTSVYWGGDVAQHPEVTDEVWDGIWKLFDTAPELMAPVVYPKQYGLAQLGRVFEAFQKREVYGKAVLHVAPKAAL